ncbi:MAG: VWA domain-containing protein [Thermoanaerobaculia bacterium]
MTRALHSYASLALAVLLALLLPGCGDGGGPSDPSPPLHLAVNVRVDSATFRNAGEFALNLVPSDRTGTTYLQDAWSISTSLTAPTTISLSTSGTGLEPPDTAPVAAAILIDDSGSMRFSDRDRVRAFAAQAFWREVLPIRPGNLVALLDFGRGDATPTNGFARTRLLAGFTSDENPLNAVLDEIQGVPGALTPLFQSGVEVINWIDTTTPRTYQRTLIVITDGVTSDQVVAEQLYDAAVAAGVRVFAIGLGAAAEHDPPGEAAVLLQQLASRTGGVYAAADPADQLQAVLGILARSADPERLLVRLRVSPIPARGTNVMGSVSLSGTRGQVSADWSFVAP